VNDPIRVVIIDDSAVARRMLTSMLTRDPAIRVVGQARDGLEGIRVVQSVRPDVVTMDVSMPGLDGLATTEHLMAYCPTPILVLTASLTSHEVDITFKMLDAGALEVIEKPNGSDIEVFERATRDLIRRVKLLSRVRVVTHLRGRKAQHTTAPAERIPARIEAAVKPQRVALVAAEPASEPGSVRKPAVMQPKEYLPAPTRTALRHAPLIMIGASTGGPRVVHHILGELPADLNAAIMVVQHIAEGFGPGMAEWLQNASRLPVRLASEDMPVLPGHVLVAPDQRDVLITPQGRIHLTQSPLLLQRPSIDVAMQAAAEVFAARTIGVLLTGMGRDGAFGMLTIRKRGGHTIAQDEQSCTIFGMPKAAIQLGAACEVLAATQIAQRLIELAGRVYPESARSSRVGTP
jgi:two-component system, chemotaxis family, protein-glutamate methylesterase/glutaminase